MRIAVAGSGSIARYISEEFPKHGHHVVLLSRSEKPFFTSLHPNVHQVVTDYSLASIQSAIHDCDVLISTILSYTADFIDVHATLIAACNASPKCKRFIPSEFGGNLDDHPDVPFFYYQTRGPVREMLRAQTDVEWTLVSVGWVMDYIVPQRNRHLESPGEAFPIDVDANTVVVPGTGREAVSLLSARDLARALAVLVSAASWEQHTYVSGLTTCWNDLVEAVRLRYPDLGETRYLGLGQVLDTVQTSTDEMEILTAQYQLYVPLGAACLPAEKVEEHRRRYFPSLRFRTAQDLLDDVVKNPQGIV